MPPRRYLTLVSFGERESKWKRRIELSKTNIWTRRSVGKFNFVFRRLLSSVIVEIGFGFLLRKLLCKFCIFMLVFRPQNIAWKKLSGELSGGSRGKNFCDPEVLWTNGTREYT